MKIVRQPAAWPQSTSRQRSPTIQLCARSMSSSRAARSNMPGLGLRQSQSRQRPGRDDNKPPRGQSATAGTFRAWMVSTTSCFKVPRPTSGWLVATTSRKPAAFNRRARRRNLGKNFKFAQARRRIRLAIALQRAVDDAIAVEKNGADPFRLHFVDSHFVCATFSLGCDTNKCQMTA